ncbi:MAG: hypothetical protein WD378_03090 [Egicoccus sp.]
MSSPALAPLRRIRLVTVAVIPLLAAVVLATAAADSTVPAVLPVLLVAVTGAAAIGGVVAANRMLERQAPTAAEAGAALRSHAFLQLAIAEFPLLLAVALAYVMGPAWVVLPGAAAALAALLIGPPTTARAHRLETLWDLPADTVTHGPPASSDDEDPDDDKDVRA